MSVSFFNNSSDLFDNAAGNLLIAADGTIHLADFGVTGQITDMTQKRNTKIGTPFWMAPEVIMELPYDGCADIWGLGITAMELANGLPPYAGKYSSWQVTLLIPKNNPPVLEGDFSELFKNFISSCLVKEPDQRPLASALLEHPFIAQAAVPSPAWQQFLAYQVLPTRPNSNGRALNTIIASGDSNVSQDNPRAANNMHKRSGSGWDFEESLYRSSSQHQHRKGSTGKHGPSRSVSQALEESSGSSFHGAYPSLPVPGTTRQLSGGSNNNNPAHTLETRSLSHSILGSGSDSSLTESGHPLASSNSVVDNDYDVTPNKSRLHGISASNSVANSSNLNASRDLLYDSSNDEKPGLPVFSDSEGSVGYEKKGLRRAVSTGSYSSSLPKQKQKSVGGIQSSHDEAYKTMPASSRFANDSNSSRSRDDDDDDSLFSPRQSSSDLIAGFSMNMGMMNHKAPVLRQDEMMMPTPRLNVPPPSRHSTSSHIKKQAGHATTASGSKSPKEKELADEITRLKAELKQAKEEILRLRTVSKPYLSALSLLNKRHGYSAISPTADTPGKAEEKRPLSRALSSNSLRDWTSVLSVSSDEDDDDDAELVDDDNPVDARKAANYAGSLSQKQQQRQAEFTLNTPESSQIISRQVLPPKPPITPAHAASGGGSGFDQGGGGGREEEEEAESKATDNNDGLQVDKFDSDKPLLLRKSFRRSKSDRSSGGANSSGGQSSHFDLAALLPITSSMTNNSSTSTFNNSTNEAAGSTHLRCSEALKKIVQPSLMALKDNFAAGRYGTQEGASNSSSGTSSKWEDAWLLLATAFSALDALSTGVNSEAVAEGESAERREPMIDLVSLISSFTIQELELPQEPML